MILETPSVHDHYTRFQRRKGAMNPEHKLLIDEFSKCLSDELSKRFEEQDDKWDRRLSDRDATWASKLDDLRASHDARVTVLEKVIAEFQDWRPEVDGVVDDLKLAVKNLNRHYERAAFEQSTSTPGILSPVPSAAAHPSAGQPADKAQGHRVDQYNREDGYGVVTALVHPPVKGTYSFPVPPPPLSNPVVKPASRWGNGASGSSYSGKLPRLDFPRFEGEQPKLWIRRATDYFDLYDVDPAYWIRLAAMNFSSAAARWLQSVDHKIRACSWPEFCQLLLDRFGRDEHELLL